MITEVVLQPILKDSEIPFDKYLLLYDGKVTMTGRLEAITKYGFQFSRIGFFDPFVLFGTTEQAFNPTHFAILNISINK